MADGWRKSKLSKDGILSLVNHRMLQSRAIIQWHSTEGHDRPYEKGAEIILFKSFVECGLAVPACDFLRGLLFFWGIQLHHLSHNSILHISIIVHLCEAFLGVYPHFNLFKSLFQLVPFPNLKNVARLGGADLQLRPESVGKYIPYTPNPKIGDWRSEWFYVDNHSPSLPERIPGLPQVRYE